MINMTWNEVENYIREVNNNIIIPVGTCEQHGYHLPLGNDIFTVEYIANILSNETGAMIAPTQNYGVNLPCDVNLAGTTSITTEILRAIILSITDWWRKQGIKHFIILTYHSDPFHIQAMENISTDIKLCDISDVEYSDILERQLTIRHACEAETSVALFLYSERVKMDVIREFDINFEEFKNYLFHKDNSMPQGYVGNLGYPSAASKEKGEIIVKRMIRKALNECNNFF